MILGDQIYSIKLRADLNSAAEKMQLQLQHELFLLRHDGRLQLRKQVGMQQHKSGQEQQQPRKHEQLGQLGFGQQQQPRKHEQLGQLRHLGQLGFGQQQLFEQQDPLKHLEPTQLQHVELQHFGFLRWHEHSDRQQQQKLATLKHGKLHKVV
ncbi:hypothetical protein HID58_045632 [Brassica napus]|uniref:Uncharacterized protein n=1 Tax=Brassica napus TaxID=3708 RepID=A0ABQ8AU35_BRANA|nr:hypothetical protein HID58_045632 [Brassica napus]